MVDVVKDEKFFQSETFTELAQKQILKKSGKSNLKNLQDQAESYEFLK